MARSSPAQAPRRRRASRRPRACLATSRCGARSPMLRARGTARPEPATTTEIAAAVGSAARDDGAAARDARRRRPRRPAAGRPRLDPRLRGDAARPRRRPLRRPHPARAGAARGADRAAPASPRCSRSRGCRWTSRSSARSTRRTSCARRTGSARRFGLHASVSGKLAYARLPDDLLERLLDDQRFERYTEHTIVDRDALPRRDRRASAARVTPARSTSSSSG